MMRLFVLIIKIVMICAVLLLPVRTAYAQSLTADDIIREVNRLRAVNGLAAYQVDSQLMAKAQSHSEYQASIGTITHLRADGSTSSSFASAENIGGGYNVTLDYLINTLWGDDLHMRTLIGYSSGQIGVGVAVLNGFYYYTLDVVNTGSITNLLPTRTASAPTITSPVGAVTATLPAITAPPTPTLYTEGAKIYEIQAGDSLWTISSKFNLTLDQLRELNNIPSNDALILPGQKILVSYPFTQTPSPIPSATLQLATQNPTPGLTTTATQPPVTSTVESVINITPQIAPAAGTSTARNEIVIGVVSFITGAALMWIFMASRRRSRY